MAIHNGRKNKPLGLKAIINKFFIFKDYICISSKSKAKQCSETRTATKSLPATELSTL